MKALGRPESSLRVLCLHAKSDTRVATRQGKLRLTDTTIAAHDAVFYDIRP